jgi:hypothetical protein
MQYYKVKGQMHIAGVSKMSVSRIRKHPFPLLLGLSSDHASSTACPSKTYHHS